MGTNQTVIILARSETFADVYAFALEECLPGLRVIPCVDVPEARKALRENHTACVMIDASVEGALQELLAERAASAPLAKLIILDSDSTPVPPPYNPEGVFVISSDPTIEELVAYVKAAQKVDADASPFLKITPERLLARNQKLRADVYVKLPNETYVKIFRAGRHFGPDEMAQLRSSVKVDSVYIRRNDFLDAMDGALAKARGYVRTLQRLGRKPIFRENEMANRQELLIIRAFERLFLLTFSAVAIVYILQFSLNRPMELPFLSLGPGPFCMNVWLVLAFLLPWSFVFDVRAICVGSISLALGFAWLNYRKIAELGRPIGFFDLWNLHFSNVLLEYVGVREAISLVILFCLPLCLRYLVNRLWKGDRSRTAAYYYFTALTAHFGLFFLFVCFEPFRSDSFLLRRFPPLPDQVEFAHRDGYPLATLLGLKFMGVFHADNYAPNTVAKILKDGAPPDRAAAQPRRNVVLVLMESFRDYSLDGILFQEDVIPFYRHLKGISGVGRYFSPTVGGGTANVEFEVLSGIPVGFLPADSIVHDQYLDHSVPTLVDRLRHSGFSTVAVHNNFGGFYRRKRVLPYLGFDQFFDVLDLTREYGSSPETRYPDRFVFQKSLDLLTKRDSGNQFQYLITYETHGPYDGVVPKREWINDPTILGDPALTSALNTYADRMRKLDDDLKWYFAQLRKLKDPPVVILFGDHQPSMSLDLPAASRGAPHRVEAVIAMTPKRSGREYVGEKPIFCLSPLIFRESGISLTPYFRYVENFCRTHEFEGPVTVTAENAQEYGNFEILTYDRLFGKQYSSPRP